MVHGHGPAEGPARGRGRDRRRRRGARRRRHPGVHRQPAPHPRLGRARRRARPHHPRRLPAARAARAPGGDRLRRDRRRVRPHVLVVRLPGHADREPPAGAAAEGPRGGRRPRGRLPRAAACGCFKGARADRHRARPTTASPSAATTAGRPRAATPCWPSARSPTPRASASRPPASTSTAPATSPINHHCQSNVPHIYAAGDLSGKLPLSSVAAMQGRKIAEHVMGLHTRRAPPPRLRQGGVGHLHRARDRRRRPGRGRRLRRGSQDPGHQGAVLGQRQGAHRRRPPRAS